MKLVPRAKPVKIRIISGGVEHNSLESLQRYFCWNDIKKVVDNGSLEKWLRRLGEYEIAEDFKDRSTNSLGLRDAYNLLFRRDNPFTSDKVLIKEYLKDSSLSLLVAELATQLSNIDLARYVKEYGDKMSIFREKLFQRIENFTGLEPASMLYDLGTLLYSISEFKGYGMRYIISAADKGHDKAIKVLEKIDRENETVKNTGGVDSLIEKEISNIYNADFREKIRNNWNIKEKLSSYGASGIKLEIINLFNTCLYVYKKYGSRRPEQGILNEIAFPKESDYLYYEKIFIRALFIPYSSMFQALNKISAYGPAKELLKRGVFEKGFLHISSGNHKENIKQLGHFIMYLDKFRVHEKGSK